MDGETEDAGRAYEVEDLVKSSALYAVRELQRRSKITKPEAEYWIGELKLLVDRNSIEKLPIRTGKRGKLRQILDSVLGSTAS